MIALTDHQRAALQHLGVAYQMPRVPGRRCELVDADGAVVATSDGRTDGEALDMAIVIANATQAARPQKDQQADE